MKLLHALPSRLPPVYVIHFVTHRCNLFCDFCCDGHNRQARNELQLGDIVRFYQALTAAQLTITGGEPTLREDLSEILAAALRARVRAVSLNSNGMLPERVERAVSAGLASFCNGTLKVNLSIDGFRATHDRLRGRSGSFDGVIETYERLTRLMTRFPRLSLRVNTVITDDNADEVAQFTRFVKFRMPRLTDHVISLHRTPPGARVEPRLLGIYRELTEQVHASRSLLPRHALLKRLHDRMYESIADVAAGGETEFQCPAGGSLVEVSAAGEVLGCEVLPKERAILGNLQEHDWQLSRVLASPAAEVFRERISRERCACTFECAHLTAAAVHVPRQIARGLDAALAALGSE